MREEAPAAIAVYAITGWLIAQERTRAVLVLQLWMNGLNIALDLWFVIGLGWGVGGIEAEAAMLGQPITMLIPEVIGFRLKGSLREGATATDLVLTVTEMLRKKGVVGKFVEFFGDGLGQLPLADRATLGNMSPECSTIRCHFGLYICQRERLSKTVGARSVAPSLMDCRRVSGLRRR